MKNLLTCENISLAVASRVFFRDLSFAVSSGDRVGILGPNGVGKSTLLHCLIGLFSPLQGTIKLHDKELKTLKPKERARKMGILFQDSSFVFSQSVHEFCLAARYPHSTFFGNDITVDTECVRHALDIMELLPKINQDILTLSGGERRRLALAALLIQQPNLYLLDEPTNHLDMRHQVNILKYFSDYAQRNNAAVLMSLHDPNQAERYCNKILLLFENGQYLYGATQTLLTETHLSNLYSCPILAIETDKGTIWGVDEG